MVLFARPAAAQDERKVFIDVHLGVAAMAEDAYSRSVTTPLYNETATFGAAYAFDRGAHFDFGGGYMFTPVLGFGVNFSGDAFNGIPVLSARVPSPVFFNTFATD